VSTLRHNICKNADQVKTTEFFAEGAGSSAPEAKPEKLGTSLLAESG